MFIIIISVYYGFIKYLHNYVLLIHKGKMWLWATKPVLSRWGIFVAVAKIIVKIYKNYIIMGQNYRFFF